MADVSAIRRVLSFWFPPEGWDLHSAPSAEAAKKAWSGSAELDEEMRDKFGALLESLAKGELESWKAEGSDGRLAYVVLCDQFTRNVYRKQGRAFSLDYKSQAVVKELLASEPGWMRRCRRQEVYQFLLVLMHSESLEDGQECLRLCHEFLALCEEDKSGAWVETARGVLKFQKEHLEQISKFGRYPGRNAALDRVSTPEELEFLKSGHTFGQ